MPVGDPDMHSPFWGCVVVTGSQIVVVPEFTSGGCVYEGILNDMLKRNTAKQLQQLSCGYTSPYVARDRGNRIALNTEACDDYQDNALGLFRRHHLVLECCTRLCRLVQKSTLDGVQVGNPKLIK